MAGVNSINTLSERSVIHITFSREDDDRAAKVVAAFTALGPESLAAELYKLGMDFVCYLQYGSTDFATKTYPALEGFRFTPSDYSEIRKGERFPLARAARVVTARNNGRLVRGWGDADAQSEVTLIFQRLTTPDWRRLAIAFGWDPDQLDVTAKRSGTIFYPSPDSEMSLLAPTVWT